LALLKDILVLVQKIGILLAAISGMRKKYQRYYKTEEDLLEEISVLLQVVVAPLKLVEVTLRALSALL
jgi:hypothetical protein